MDANDRCPVCDRPEATAEQWARVERDESIPAAESASVCWGEGEPQCTMARVDWHARALAAEAERDEARAAAKWLREREEHFARALSVADGGQYRNDWDGALRRLIAERDALRAEVDMLRGVGCDELDGDDVLGPCGACLKCARRERDEARRLLAAAARGELPQCVRCRALATVSLGLADAGLCDEHASGMRARYADEILPDLPHAAALRSAVGGGR